MVVNEESAKKEEEKKSLELLH